MLFIWWIVYFTNWINSNSLTSLPVLIWIELCSELNSTWPLPNWEFLFCFSLNQKIIDFFLSIWIWKNEKYSLINEEKKYVKTPNPLVERNILKMIADANLLIFAPLIIINLNIKLNYLFASQAHIDESYWMIIFFFNNPKVKEEQKKWFKRNKELCWMKKPKLFSHNSNFVYSITVFFFCSHLNFISDLHIHCMVSLSLNRWFFSFCFLSHCSC